MHGQFAWYELTTADIEGAIKFYKTFTGWGTQPFDADYTMFTNNGVPFAGVFKLTDAMSAQGVPPNWMPYIETKNVAETAQLATSFGATVMHGPVDIPNVGQIAVIQDPQGAVFGVYRSTSGGRSWDGTPEIGNISWNELMTTEHNQAFAFYRALFGWDKVSEMDMGDGFLYLMFGQGNKMYGGMFTTPAEMSGMHPFWLCYIHVKDVNKSLAMATKAGAIVHRPSTDIPDGVIAILGDPQGAGFALHHLSAPAAATSSPKAAITGKSGTKVKPKTRVLATKSNARTAKAKSNQRTARKKSKTSGGASRAKKTSRKRATKTTRTRSTKRSTRPVRKGQTRKTARKRAR